MRFGVHLVTAGEMFIPRSFQADVDSMIENMETFERAVEWRCER